MAYIHKTTNCTADCDGCIYENRCENTLIAVVLDPLEDGENVDTDK